MTYDVRYCTISSSEDGRTIGRYFDEDEKLAKIMWNETLYQKSFSVFSDRMLLFALHKIKWSLSYS